MPELTHEQMIYAVGVAGSFVTIGAIYFWSKWGAEIDSHLKRTEQEKQAKIDQKNINKKNKKIPPSPENIKKVSSVKDVQDCK